MPSKKLYIVFMAWSLLPGCFFKQPKKNKKDQQQHADLSVFKAFHGQSPNAEHSAKVSRDVVLDACVYEARLFDIPIPLQACLDAHHADEQRLIKYSTTLTELDLYDFYTREMERLGWDQQFSCRASETVMVFKKPGRWASISIRPKPASLLARSDERVVVIHTDTH